MPDVQILRKKSYLAMIRNAARGENNMFRNLFALVDGVEQDILQNGQLSCAAFASSVLVLNGLLDHPYATVSSMEKGLEAAGWVQGHPEEGAVLVWEPKDGHLHAGFYLGNDRAVSNSSNEVGFPVEHHCTYDDTRAVLRAWLHSSLK